LSIRHGHTKSFNILIIDDDVYICGILEKFMKDAGFNSEISYNSKTAIKKLQNQDFDLVFCDYRLPETTGYEMLEYIKNNYPSLPVIIMTAYGDISMAVKLIKAGADDYITKPVLPEDIIRLINRTVDKNKTDDIRTFGKNFIFGKSEAIQKVFRHLEAVAPTDITVLLDGETGSGKEYIARAIHFKSKRKDKPFVAVDCGAIPRDLANSELFGHIKGSFTGAIADKKGYFEVANGGTLFLDEVGNLSHENQVKLLRALQEKVINRVGESKNIGIDVRVIAASNEDLLKNVRERTFREDLYHRLNGFKIRIPPLREREEDILIFADNFLKKASKRFEKQIAEIDEDVKQMLLNYPWHGNIRELENLINRCVLLAPSNTITVDVLPDELKSYYHENEHPQFSFNNKHALKDATKVAERKAIADALQEANYNKSKAARILNIDRKTLYNKIKQFNIEVIEK
jgi:two-component system, NtrC family, response regulator HydG